MVPRIFKAEKKREMERKTVFESQWDNAVEATSDDAAISKLSATKLGYFDDKYMTYFVARKKFIRRSPIINRGYFARVAARDKVVEDFLRATNRESQIVSLGAGSDTLYFRLVESDNYPKRYVEVDLPAVVKRKKTIIAKTDELKSKIKDDIYSLYDLDITNTEMLIESLLKLENFSFDIPTLFLSECVLVYIEPEKSMKIIQAIQQNFKESAVFVYEQVRPDDAFGKVMMKNLKNRGCPLKGLIAHRSPEMQIDRFKNNGGFTDCECFDMNDIYYKGIAKETLKRIEKLEIFDEFEEWHLMSAHYAIVLAKNYPDNTQSVIAKLHLIQK